MPTSSVYCTPDLQLAFNQNLPNEIIFIIMSYLSPVDLIHLCISKLFAPCILEAPIFYQKLHEYIKQTFSVRIQTQEFPPLYAAIPFTNKGTFYIWVHIQRLKFYKKKYSTPKFPFKIYLHHLQRIPYILKSFEHYKVNKETTKCIGMQPPNKISIRSTFW